MASMLSSIRGLMAMMACGTAVAAASYPTADTILLPTEDPWYTNPANISLYKPGEVISHRQVSNRLNSALPDDVTMQVNSSHQYLYRTTDSLGDPVAAVMTVLVPKNPDPSKLLAHQTAYDSANLNCAPSYSLRAGANYTALADTIFIAAALDQGWYVTTADFHGLYGQFCAGMMAGHSTLDSVRATLAEGHNLGLNPDAKYALFGYSGGSIGVEWAAELQPTYAPELNFVGAALGGLAPNVSHVLMTVNNAAPAGLAFAGIQGLSKAYPNLSNFMTEHMIPSKVAEYEEIGRGCLTQLSTDGSYQNLWNYMDQGESLIYEAIPQSVMELAGLAGRHGTPRMPMFIIEATGDEISPIADTDTLVNQFCADGALIEYHRDSFGEHVSEAVTGGPSAFEWLGDRLAGKPLTNKACVTKNVYLSSIDPGLYPTLGQVYIAMLQSTLSGGNLGRYLGISG